MDTRDLPGSRASMRSTGAGAVHGAPAHSVEPTNGRSRREPWAAAEASCSSSERPASAAAVAVAEQLLRVQPGLAEINGDTWKHALSKAVVTRCANGAVVAMKRGKDSARLVVVLQGSLCVKSAAPDGRTLKIYRVLPGELCAGSIFAACDVDMKELEVRAEGQSVLLELCAASLQALLGEPAFQAFFMQSMARTFATLLARLEEMSFEGLRERVLRRLTELSSVVDGTAHLSHQELAEELGSTREAVSRVLKELERQGTVSLGRRTIALSRSTRPPG